MIKKIFIPLLFLGLSFGQSSLNDLNFRGGKYYKVNSETPFSGYVSDSETVGLEHIYSSYKIINGYINIKTILKTIVKISNGRRDYGEPKIVREEQYWINSSNIRSIKLFSERGQVISHIDYDKLGRKEKEVTYYNSNGQVSKIIKFENGKEVDSKYFSIDGKEL